LKAVADTSSLIHSAKVPKFWTLLKDTFEEILIPEAVYNEILKGKEIQSQDVPIIEDAISKGWIKVIKVRSVPRMPENLGKGEKEAIALMEQRRIDWLLIDDRIASITARLRGLKVRSIAYLLIYWKRKGKISEAEANILLDDLVRSGYYLSPKDYVNIKQLIASET